MSDYTTSTTTPTRIAERLTQTQGPIVVVTHAKPDGDAFGSVVALTGTLRRLGKDAVGVLVPPVAEPIAALPGSDLTVQYHDEMDLPDAAIIVIVDTGAWSQVGPLRSFIEPRLENTIIIDHHLSGDIPAAQRWVNGEAAAACELIAELVELLIPDGLRGKRETDTTGYSPLPDAIRDALFVGIASDTGWFRFSNTRPHTHELAAKLIRQGTDHASLFQKLEQNERTEKLDLLIRALNSLKRHGGGKAALMSLRQKDFVETGALPEETERLIDTPQMVGQFQVFVVATEAGDEDAPQTRLSFRSRHTGDEHAINVAELAQQFGGGGHARAAGAKVDRPIDQVTAELGERLDAIFTSQTSSA